MADRPYIFFELTNSLCSTCLRKVEAKVIFQEGRVYLVKHCPEHRQEKVLISTDVEYYQFSRRALEARYDAAEVQHDDRAGLSLRLRALPRSRAAQLPGPGRDHRPLQPDLPDLLLPKARPGARRIARWSKSRSCSIASCETKGARTSCRSPAASRRSIPSSSRCSTWRKQRPIKHLMVNTNGVRIAQEPDFARRLAEYKPNFEVYLQFDSLDAAPATCAPRGRSGRGPHPGTRAT